MMFVHRVEYYSKTAAYSYVSELGAGSLGRIVLVRDQCTLRHYALKIINKEKMTMFKAELNIEREILIHMKLSHKNIVKFIETFEDDFNIYLLLEYCPRGSLYMLQQQGLWRENAAFDCFQQVLSAVDYLHSRGIVHRDLKPDNILIAEDGSYKICDFGWAISLQEDAFQHPELCGTSDFMAPEIVTGQPHNFKVDVWSLGAIFYDLLHGQRIGDFQVSPKLDEDLQILLYAMLSKPISQRPSCKQIFVCKWMKRMMRERNLFNKYENELLKTKINKNLEVKTLPNSCFDIKQHYYHTASTSENSSLTQSYQSHAITHSGQSTIPHSHQDLFDSVPKVEDPALP